METFHGMVTFFRITGRFLLGIHQSAMDLFHKGTAM